ncbi:MAG: hypothetical protein OYG31_01130 [Candidatus Kaiserbacteria bacterium]|nr:hypothetical protein [Candidatus Kaiserbacteria bacterium]
MYAVYKNSGETPLACIDRLFDRSKHTYTYAGRLDPLAEGLLIILVDDECKKASSAYGLSKTYQFSFVVGVATDSYDCLGRITEHKPVKDDTAHRVRRAVSSMQGSLTMPYPPYSSKAVQGKPLHQHARDGTLASVTIPETTMTISSFEILRAEQLSLSTVRNTAEQSIRRVRGDFRQTAILKDWSNLQETSVYQIHAQASVGAGTYIRSLVHAIGNQIGQPTVTTHIKRTAVGNLSLTDVTQSPVEVPFQRLQERVC